MRTHVVALNVVLTVLITAALLIFPLYEGYGARFDKPHDTQKEVKVHSTLIQVNGAAKTLFLLSLPIAFSVLPLFLFRMARISGWCLLGFALLGIGTIGLCYLPAAAILLFAGRK